MRPDGCSRVKRKCEHCEIRLVIVKDFESLLVMKCPRCQREYWYFRSCTPIWKLWRADE